MPHLDRYLLRQLFPPFSIALAATLTLGLSSQWLRLLTHTDLLLESPASLALLTAYLLPALSGVVLPAAFLAAMLATVGRLAADGEVIALAAAGYSPWRLTRPFLLAATAATLLTALAGNYGEPWGRRHARLLLADLQGAALSSPLSPGVLRPLLPGLTLLRSAPPRSGFMLADDRTSTQHFSLLAEAGRLGYDRAAQAVTIDLERGALLRAQAGGDYLRADFSALHLTIPLTTLTPRTELADLYPGELRARIDRLRREGRPDGLEQLALEKKTALPAACLAFALLALPLGATRSRAPRSRAYLLAATLLLSYYLLIRLVDAVAPQGPLPARLTVWIPDLLLATLGVVALQRRARRS